MQGVDNKFMAGACAVDITPLDIRNVYLAGFGPNRMATGVLDPIWARAIYLSDGNTELVIVACDLIGLLQPFVEKVRKSISGIPSENIFICSTHSHSGPDTMGLWGPTLFGLEIPYATGVNSTYMDFLGQQIAHSVQRARKKALPAKIGFGKNTAGKDDIVWNVRQAGYMDHTLSVMRIDRADGEGTIATLTNFGCHPETLWEHNTRISPDYPVGIHRTIERKLGGVSVYISGALGGMVTPGLSEDAPLHVRESFYVNFGAKLGKIALDTAKNVTFEAVPEISVKTKTIFLPLSNKLFSLGAGIGLFDRGIQKGNVVSQAGVIRIGSAGIATTPGELLPKVGMRVKRLLGGTPNFIFCLANDEIGYVLDKNDYEDDLFHYERSMSVGPDTADIITEACRELAE